MIVLVLDLPSWVNGGVLVLALIGVVMLLYVGADRMVQRLEAERQAQAADEEGEG